MGWTYRIAAGAAARRTLLKSAVEGVASLELRMEVRAASKKEAGSVSVNTLMGYGGRVSSGGGKMIVRTPQNTWNGTLWSSRAHLEVFNGKYI